MIKISTSVWRTGIATTSLALAIAVYALARENPPSILSALHAPHAWLVEHGQLVGSAPSLFYTLAIGLLLGVTSAKRSQGRLHCLIWIGIALALEVTQTPGISGALTGAATGLLPQEVADFILSYWSHGVFDPVDLLATLLGGALAMILLEY